MTQPQTPRLQVFASYLLVVLLLLGLHAGAMFAGLTPVLQGEMPDSDTYMRLVRVQELVDSGAWLNSTTDRMNAPHGDTLNWTRPLDVLIIAAALPFKGELGYNWHEALFWGGAVLPVLLHLVFGLCVAWMAAPFFAPSARPLLMLVVCIQPIVFIYNVAGRPDHQTLLLISAALMLGFVTRALTSGARALRAGLWAGMWAGFGLWVSTEFEFALAVVTAALALLWLYRGELRVLELLEGLAIGFLLLVFAGVLAERGDAWSVVRELDKISLSQLVGAGINCGLWGTTAWLCQRGGMLRRLLAFALVSLAALCLGMLLAPELLRGPAGDIDARVMQEFFLKIREMRPLWPTSWENFSYLLLCLGVPLLALPLWLWTYRREKLTPWLPLVALTSAFTVFALFHARFAQFAEPFGAVLLLAVVIRVGTTLAERPLLQRAGAQAGLLMAPLLGAALVMGLVPMAPLDHFRCAIKPVSSALDQLPQGIVMAPLNSGPELIYFTHHDTVAGPYHRNARGILDSIDFFGAADDAKARLILRQRGVKYVLSCPDASALPDSRSARLAAGNVPDWLTPLPLPEGQDLSLYAVK